MSCCGHTRDELIKAHGCFICLQAEVEHWKRAHESAMAAGEVLKAELTHADTINGRVLKECATLKAENEQLTAERARSAELQAEVTRLRDGLEELVSGLTLQLIGEAPSRYHSVVLRAQNVLALSRPAPTEKP